MISLIISFAIAMILATVLHGGARRFVRDRLRYVDAVQKGFVPFIAGGAVLVAFWPLAAVLPFVGLGTALTAGLAVGEVDVFAATSGPGLATSLMIGASIAKGLALASGKPYLAINHLEGHLLSPFFDADEEVQPNVSLVVSGGHTLLVEVRGVGDYRILGRTLDDAAGEAFDKVAKMLGLGYPGGPEIERRARAGDPSRFEFPRSMLGSGDHNFSFSGLKTAVRYALAKMEQPLDEQVLADFCASFQTAVTEVLVRKSVAAARACGAGLITLSGGVSCNAALRGRMEAACAEARLKFRAAPRALTTDNAAMIAFAAQLRFAAGAASDVSEEINPNLALA
jgi:N6-L-threonylcarbamoyladenine synthase